jgi:hypothetical protein
MKWQKYAPRIIITGEMIEAFVNEDWTTLHLAVNWAPWEYSPLQDNLPEPGPDETPAGDLRQRSLWRALALREKLQNLAEREGIKPRRRRSA